MGQHKRTEMKATIKMNAETRDEGETNTQGNNSDKDEHEETRRAKTSGRRIGARYLRALLDGREGPVGDDFDLALRARSDRRFDRFLSRAQGAGRRSNGRRTPLRWQSGGRQVLLHDYSITAVRGKDLRGRREVGLQRRDDGAFQHAGEDPCDVLEGVSDLHLDIRRLRSILPPEQSEHDVQQPVRPSLANVRPRLAVRYCARGRPAFSILRIIDVPPLGIKQVVPSPPLVTEEIEVVNGHDETGLTPSLVQS